MSPINELKPPDLSDRQLEALRHVGEGLSNEEIASLMGVTPRTVKYYVDVLRSKFGVKQRRMLIRIAREMDT